MIIFFFGSILEMSTCIENNGFLQSNHELSIKDEQIIKLVNNILLLLN
jgi:hypothetical protein